MMRKQYQCLTFYFAIILIQKTVKTVAFGILQHAAPLASPCRRPTSFITSSCCCLNLSSADNLDPKKNLHSLLDEAVLLHASENINENKDVQNLIEEIAHAMHKSGESSSYNSSSIISSGGSSSSSSSSRQQQRTVNDVRKELDTAVVHLQSLSMQDDEEKWTHIVEQLAIEYHELVTLESTFSTAFLTKTDYDDDNHDEEEELISLSSSLSTSTSTSTSTSSIVVAASNESNVVSMDDMIQDFEFKLEKLYQEHKAGTTTSSTAEEIGGMDHKYNDTMKEMSLIKEKEKKEEPTAMDKINMANDYSDSISANSNSPKKEGGNTKHTEQNKTHTNAETKTNNNKNDDQAEEVDIAIIGAGIGGLCAGAILNTLYDKRVGIYESHYLPGGCAHAFPATATIEKEGGSVREKVSFTFDSGPTIVLGCSTKPYNPLRQVLNAVGLSEEVEWIPYQGWGMIENPSMGQGKELRWSVELGPDLFENGPLREFGGEDAVKEFQELRKVTKGLVSGAVEIPAMAMRGGNSALIPLLRYLPALSGLIAQGEEVTQGTFGQFMDGPKFEVKNEWLRDWLDALAFSLSGLPACRTSAAAMAYVIYDMHREGAALDYPKGGLGSVIDGLVKGVQQGSNGSAVHLRQHVESIDTSPDGSFIRGLTLKSGKKIIAKDGVICNAPVWSLNELMKNNQARMVLNNALPVKKRSPRQTWTMAKDENKNKINYVRPPLNEGDDDTLLAKCDSAEMTGSFLHLHLALDAKDLDLDSMEAHYTVMDRGLGGDGSVVDGYADGPCGELNMIAVSNPCVLDRSLAPEGYVLIHAYGAGNEPYGIWEDLERNSKEYNDLKQTRAEALWRAVESAIPDARERVVLSMIGSPKTHERFLRRPRGTYGASTEDYLRDGSTPFERLKLCGDGIFPGIGIPAVALSGASAANSMVSPWKQWKCLDSLKSKKLI